MGITSKSMKVAIYARVSTTDQHNEIQVKELTEYVQRRGWELAGIYQDQMGGARAQRPGLDALMAGARLHQFDAVVVMKLDRFGRSLINCVAGIQELTAAGVRFLATSQGLDTDVSSPTSRLLLHILAAVAEFERELIKERVSAGLKHAKANGAPIGRPRRVFDRQKALDMREQGMSYPALAQALGVGYGTVVSGIGALSKTQALNYPQLPEDNPT
jgi:putative DNA-invertase from lambdoid prophage Rac